MQGPPVTGAFRLTVLLAAWAWAPQAGFEIALVVATTPASHDLYAGLHVAAGIRPRGVARRGPVLAGQAPAP